MLQFLSLGLLGITLPASPPIESPHPVQQNPFLVECHCFIRDTEEPQQDYGYHLIARGFSQNLPNGIEVTFEPDKIRLSVDRKPADTEEYSPLYQSLPLIKRQESSCTRDNCPSVEYESPMLRDKLAITYDKAQGRMLVAHTLESGRTLEGRGGCVFISLPRR
ncbi:hypothetical protein IQ249_23240 [Lusitaniella coriacea LEGE 07157]|uniref:Uncharacterized protein n=1 Tax=Lusitaniella coriacea LEGE 07157 TaxID=945747 RepID=A0A8J7E0F3_9CYAN|nr:hypothetical protein [Lusitaniella coriacea]MBE9118808.1 hypothetical protein [Lusitaniella coriacea LEGE 07157]